MVGALIVEKGEVVAQGFHQKSGGPHAEVEALNSLGRQPSPDASIIISLEPCSTHGKTPPVPMQFSIPVFKRSMLPG